LVAPELKVTFVTTEPDVAISLRKRTLYRPLGTTGRDRTVSTKLARGTHTLSLTCPCYVGRLNQEISVQQDGATITLNFPPRPSPKLKAASDLAPPPPSPTPTPTPAPPAIKAETIIARFMNPKEMDSVDLADWQEVWAQTHAAVIREPENLQLKALELFAAGQLEYSRGDYDSALAAFKRVPADAAPPESWLVAYGIANTYLAKRRFAEAEAEYRRAIKINPKFGPAHKGLGDALSKQRQSATAINAYQSAKSLGYATSELPYSMTHQSARLSMPKNCRQALSELLLLKNFTEGAGLKIRNELQADVHADMGECYAELKNTRGALEAYRRAVELDPDNAWAHYRFGEALFKAEVYEDAVKNLERAIRLFGQYNQQRDKESQIRAIDLKVKAEKKLSKR
jgi:tetratricopeptide (TPR) repeat protein